MFRKREYCRCHKCKLRQEILVLSMSALALAWIVFGPSLISHIVIALL